MTAYIKLTLSSFYAGIHFKYVNLLNTYCHIEDLHGVGDGANGIVSPCGNTKKLP